MSYKAIIQDLKAKKFSNVYFFFGSENYYIDKLTSYCEKNILDEGLKAFNQTTLYGKEADARRIIDELSQFPMMAQHRVVILKEAQDMKTFGDLLPIIEKPIPHGILVIAYKNPKVDKRTKLGKIILKKSVVLESKALYDNQVASWVNEYANEIGIKIEFDASQLIAEYLGTDLQKISNELDKLKLGLSAGGSVTLDQVQEQIGISKEFNVFELQKAISERNVVKSNMIVQYFGQNQKTNPIQMTVSSLFGYFMKVYITHQNASQTDNILMRSLGLGSPFFVKEYRLAAKNYPISKVRSIINEIKEVDLKSKGVGNRSNDSGALLNELIYYILH